MAKKRKELKKAKRPIKKAKKLAKKQKTKVDDVDRVDVLPPSHKDTAWNNFLLGRAIR